MASTMRFDKWQNTLGAGNVSLESGNFYSPGSVLQVVSSSSITGTVIATTSWTQVGGSNLTVTITPKFATSKILIMADVGYYAPNGGNGYLGIYRGGGAVQVAEYGYYQYQTGEFNYGSVSILDSPNTTSSTLYSVYARGGSTSSWTINYADGGGQVRSTITAFEIAQ